MQSALETLLERGFLEEPQTKLRFMGSTPRRALWLAEYRLRPQPPRRDAVGVSLMPAPSGTLILMERASGSILFSFLGQSVDFHTLRHM
jgi:hypothetical protein